MAVKRWTAPVIAGLAAGVWQAHQHYPTGLFDLYPLRAGALALLRTGDGYRFAGVVPPHDLIYNVARVGNVYPLTANLLALPLVLLPPAAAGALYTALCAAAAVRLAAAAGWGPLGLAFYPLLVSLGIEQAETAVLLAAAAALLARTRHGPGWRWAAALMVASIKPSVTGPLIVLEMIRGGRAAWRPAALIAALLAAAFAVEPGWFAAWAHTAAARDAGQTPAWPLALPALLAAWWGDWTLAAVLITFTYTPYSTLGVYQLAPLMLGLDRRRSALMTAAGASYYLAFAFVPSMLSAGLLLITPRLLLASPRIRAAITAAPSYGLWRLADLALPGATPAEPVQTVQQDADCVPAPGKGIRPLRSYARPPATRNP